MCFSATASFTLAAVLVPAGVYTVLEVRRTNPAWWAFAVFPLVFGIQQVLEGILWLGLAGGNEVSVCFASRGFLFFSHFFWLAWVPFAVWTIETDPARKRLALFMAVAGFFAGLSVFLPAALIEGWLRVEVIQRSLEYKTTLIYEGLIERSLLRTVYAVIVIGSLLLSSHRLIQVFGGLVAASLVLTYVFYAYAFISVWCFFAAILSVYLAVILGRETGDLHIRTRG